MSQYEHIQDTIALDRSVERTVISDTVKITVSAQAVIKLGTTDNDLREKVLAMLNSFVQNENWSISNVRRVKDMQNERVTLSATARVPEGENNNLDRRAADASSETMEIIERQIQVDNSIPKKLIQQAEAEMRKELAELAYKDAEAYTKCIPGEGAYRVHALYFGGAGAGQLSNSTYATAAMISSAAPVGGRGPQGIVGSGGGALGNAQKFSMEANYTLARIVKA